MFVFGITTGFYDDTQRKLPVRMEVLESPNFDSITETLTAHGNETSRTGDEIDGTLDFDDGSYIDFTLITMGAKQRHSA